MTPSQQSDINLRFQDLITRTAERVDTLDVRVNQHELDLKDFGKQVDALVTEVQKIRNALYLLALMVSANIPAVASIAGWFKHFLF